MARGWILPAAVMTALWFSGFECASGDGVRMTVREFSSIPPITRQSVFAPDGIVTIYEPPSTTSPLTVALAPDQRDSIARLVAGFADFDTVYYTPPPIPNPSHLVLEFTRGGATRVVRINNSPRLPPALDTLVSMTARIIYDALRLHAAGGR